jgi:hypothetical protein
MHEISNPAVHRTLRDNAAQVNSTFGVIAQ